MHIPAESCSTRIHCLQTLTCSRLSLVPRAGNKKKSLSCLCNRKLCGSGNVQYFNLNRWDGVRVRLGPGYGIVSGNASGNTVGVTGLGTLVTTNHLLKRGSSRLNTSLTYILLFLESLHVQYIIPCACLFSSRATGQCLDSDRSGSLQLRLRQCEPDKFSQSWQYANSQKTDS